MSDMHQGAPRGRSDRENGADESRAGPTWLRPTSRGSPERRRGLIRFLNDVLLAWGKWLDGRGDPPRDGTPERGW